MLKIFRNPNDEVYRIVTKAVKDNGGYCPCMLSKSEDTKCPCREFREQEFEGECHCGRYTKLSLD